MNRRPPQTPQPLDAGERALAALLPRPHGRSEPGAELDARILAAARAATQPAKAQPASPRRRSWIAPTAVAASLMLAVGLAWQLRPPPALPAPAAAGSAAADSDAMAVQAIMAPPPAHGEDSAAQPRPMAMTPAPAEAPVAARIAGAAAAASPAVATPEVATAPPPPPAPPAPAVADEFFPAPAAAEQVAEPARAPPPAMAKAAGIGEIARERSSAAGSAAVQEQAARAADATTLDTVTIADPEEPDEDVPPATADSPAVRDAWLRRIGELLKQGKTEDARASLAEFRRRYPDATLPPELRKLEH